MTEQEKKVESGEVVQSAEDYIATINSIKKNSVPREEYEKLIEERRQLLKSLETSKPQETSTDEVPEDLNMLRNKLNNSKNDIEYVENVLHLRETVLKQEGVDIFVNPHSGVDESSDSEEVANFLRECIDQSGGSNAVFIAKVGEKIIDMPRYRKK